jgi:MoaA/NifB/PqqE/SkfB family radical SAM enzyme
VTTTHDPRPTTLEVLRRQATLTTHRIHTLPVLVLMPHSRCNCRCVMCDIWKANEERRELSREDLSRQLGSLRALHVQRVVLSGGEALMHPNLWRLCELLKELPVRITLLSTGLLLEAYATAVARWCDEVIVSLDGSQPVHDAIRRIPHAYERLGAGVAAVKALGVSVSGRCVVQRANFRDLPNVIDSAHSLALDRISFLAADVSSTAFNRPEPWQGDRVSEVALDPDESTELGQIVEDTIGRYAHDFATGFIAESPDKLRRLPRYFAALNGDGDFPTTVCNAPWVSTVVEADGTVRPCFFHRRLGNIHDRPLADILNAPESVEFRRSLDVREDPICRKCVCSLSLSRRAPA